MITYTSDTFNTKVKENARRWSNCVVFDVTSTTTESFYDLRELTVDRGLIQGDDFSIGGLYRSSVELVISETAYSVSWFKTHSRFSVLARLLVDESAGTYETVRMGVYHVVKAEKEGKGIRIEAVDNSYLFSSKEFAIYDGVDKTASTLMAEIIARFPDMTYTGTNFSYDPVIPASRYMDYATENKITYQDMMSWIATVCSANIYIDEYGRVTMRRPEEITYDYITADNYTQFSYDTGVQSITGLTINRPLSKGREKVYEYGDLSGKTMVVEDNPLLSLDLGQEMYNYIKSFTYRTFEVHLPLADPRVEPGDIVYCRDVDNTLLKCPIFSQQFNLAGGCSATYSAEAVSYEEDLNDFEGVQSIQIRNMGDTLNDMEKKIDDTVESLTEKYDGCAKTDTDASFNALRTTGAWLYNTALATQTSFIAIARSGSNRWRFLLNADNTLSISSYSGDTYQYTPLKLNRDGSVTIGGDCEATNGKFSTIVVGDNETCTMSMPSSNTWQLKVVNGSYNNSIQLVQNSSNANAIFRPATTDKIQLGQASYKWTAVYATNTAIQSDRKVKRDIQDIADPVLFIMSLQPRQYKMKDSDTETGRLHYGFIAQEVAEVAKNVLGKNLSLAKASFVTYDENGNAVDNYFRDDVSDEKLSWYLDYNEIISPLVATVQSQQKEIDELKKRLSDLEEKVNLLLM